MCDNIVEGKITSLEEYGLYAKTHKGPVLILIVDVCEDEPTNIKNKFNVGEKIKLKILRWVDDYNLYKGSMIGIDQDN